MAETGLIPINCQVVECCTGNSDVTRSLWGGSQLKGEACKAALQYAKCSFDVAASLLVAFTEPDLRACNGPPGRCYEVPVQGVATDTEKHSTVSALLKLNLELAAIEDASIMSTAGPSRHNVANAQIVVANHLAIQKGVPVILDT